MINRQRGLQMFSIIRKSKNMQSVAQGATAGVGGCQTLGQVS